MATRPGTGPSLSQTASALALLALAGTSIHAATSPQIPAMAIRAMFVRGARDTAREMTPYAPTFGVDAGLNLRYGGSRAGTRFDVFTPANGTEPLPTIVWIHGGAWISGSKDDIRPYLRMLASHGYTVVGLDYPVAPEVRYPTALHELNSALEYLTDNAARLRIDPTRIVLAGDSAGAQLASQLATAVTSVSYARDIRIVPALTPEQLRGVVLHCGIYDLAAMSNVSGIASWGFKTALWAYVGVRAWEQTPAARAMSTIDHVTNTFPPTFISGGNGDLLTATQSRPMAERLASVGVAVTDRFWDTDHPVTLPHEYQFHLDFKDARATLAATLGWLAEVTTAP